MSFPCGCGADNLFSNCQFFGKAEPSALDLVACQASAALPAGGTWQFNFWTAFCDGPKSNVFTYCLPPAETIQILKLVDQTGRFLEKKVTMKMLLFLTEESYERTEKRLSSRSLLYTRSLGISSMATIANLDKKEPFDAFDEEGGTKQGLIHIRIQQRTGRKTITTVQGISEDYDLDKIVRYLAKSASCSGTIVTHPEHGQVIQFSGDQRQHIKDFLIKVGIAKENNVKVHGF